MYLLTYSFIRWTDGKLLHGMALAPDPLDWLIRKRAEDETVCLVWLHELGPLERRRVEELKAVKVKVDE